MTQPTMLALTFSSSCLALLADSISVRPLATTNSTPCTIVDRMAASVTIPMGGASIRMMSKSCSSCDIRFFIVFEPNSSDGFGGTGPDVRMVTSVPAVWTISL